MKLVFKTIGWVNGSHTHQVEIAEIEENYIILCDVCPICGYITEEDRYRGLDNPSFLGAYKSIEDTHGSEYHGEIPKKGKEAPEKIEKMIEEMFF